MSGFDSVSIYTKLITAGTSACIADAVTFPLDTAKVRLQVRLYTSLYRMSQNEPDKFRTSPKSYIAKIIIKCFVEMCTLKYGFF